MAEKQTVTNPWALGLALWLLAGCASLGGSGTGNDTTGQISFFYEDPDAKTVSVVGSFNGWTPGANPLLPAGAGEWKITMRLPKGTHQYMFVIDGKTWVTDPKAHRTLEDGFGRINGLLVVE